MNEDLILAIVLGIFPLILLFYKIYTVIKEKFNKYKNKKEYEFKYNNDPIFKLQEDYKQYTNGQIITNHNVWLDSEYSNEIIMIKDLNKVLFEGSIDDQLMKTIIEVKKTLGEELKRCRECGNIEWAYINKMNEYGFKYYKYWNGFCSERCEEKCKERDIEHYWRITKKTNYFYNYKEKKNHIKKYNFDTNEFDIIPMYEFSEKQNFRCAICNGKMNHNWRENENNYLYHTIDHILPISKGGRHNFGNIQIVHFLCNMVKGTGKNIKLNVPADKFLYMNRNKEKEEDELIIEYKKYIVI